MTKCGEAQHSQSGWQSLFIRAAKRLGKRYLRDRTGVTAIEFALVGLPFFLIVLGSLELGLAFFVNRVLDNAVLETSRLVRTGQAQQAGFSANDFKNDICTHLPGFLCNTDNIVIDVTSYDHFSELDSMAPMVDEDANGNLEFNTNYDIGCAGSIVVTRIIYKWPMFTSLLRFDAGDTGNSERLLYATTVFRNEPFPWSCS